MNKTCSDNRYFLSLVCASPWEYNVAPDPMPSLSSGHLGWWTSAGLACSEPSPLSDSSPILHRRANPTWFRWVRSQHPLPKVSIQTWPMSISTGYFASTGKTEFSYLWGFFFFFWLLFFVLVFFFCCTLWHGGSQFPNQVSNPAACSGSTESQSLDHRTTRQVPPLWVLKLSCWREPSCLKLRPTWSASKCIGGAPVSGYA